MIYLFIAIQLLSIQFAISMAKHDGPAVTSMETNGAGPATMSLFHRPGWWAKLFFAVACSLIPEWGLWAQMTAFGGVSGLWVYLLFDPVLNRERNPKRSWDYLGVNDGDGRFWKRIGGKEPGKTKALILSLAIITINLLMFLL